MPAIGSMKLTPCGSIILANAEALDHLIGELWKRPWPGNARVVVIGHSIGGAVTTALAARLRDMTVTMLRRMR